MKFGLMFAALAAVAMVSFSGSAFAEDKQPAQPAAQPASTPVQQNEQPAAAKPVKGGKKAEKKEHKSK